MSRLLISLIFLSLFIFGCEKSQIPPECEDYQTFYKYPDDYEWAVPYQLGDTVRYKLSERHPTDSGKYSYDFLKYIQVTLADTFRDTIILSYPKGDCTGLFWSVRKVYRFEGDTTVDLLIRPVLGGADIILYLRKKEFHQSVNLINKGGDLNFRPFYYVNGNWYPSINLSAGYEVGDYGRSRSYTDSTIMFYNLTEGVVRAIVDDKYIYELTR